MFTLHKSMHLLPIMFRMENLEGCKMKKDLIWESNGRDFSMDSQQRGYSMD